MRRIAVAALATIGFGFASTTPQAQMAQCIVAGSPSPWGVNSTGYIQVPPGSGCMLSLTFIGGEILNSQIAQNPAQGSLQRIDVASYTYTAGASGSDSFAIQATGQGPSSSGVSLLTINVSIR